MSSAEFQKWIKSESKKYNPNTRQIETHTNEKWIYILYNYRFNELRK
tara:strand:- start:117 stop:257 length:141 start_codon:yes stop_codon:yes gene_type:complete